MAEEYNEPEAMRTYLINAGVPAEAVIADYAGFDTYDSCVRALRIFGVTKLIVVTQSYHLPRAVASCRALGIEATGVGDDSVRHGVAWKRGAIRDQLACAKTVIDLATGRDPVLGRPETSVAEALAR
jgi:vancomycin permeability regulator SanA